MRHYPANSPQAAARILALALLADGAIDPSELHSLRQARLLERLGMSERQFDEVIRVLCEDLLLYAGRSSSGQLEIGREALRQVLGELTLPRLQRRVLQTVLDIVNADGCLAGGEAVLVSLAVECWDFGPHETLRVTPQPGRRWPPQVARLARADARPGA